MTHGRLGLRNAMFLAMLLASAAGLVAVLILVGPGLRTRAQQREHETLLAEARLMARLAESHLSRGGSLDQLDAIVDAAAGEVHARVTIVAPDGRVVADSALSGEALAAVGNHGDRPEVRAALATGQGYSLRRSATVEADLMYLAVPIRQGREVRAVSRVAYSVADIEAQVALLRRGVALSLLLALAVSALLAGLLSGSLIRPIRRIRDAARSMAQGDLTSRIEVERSDELGELGVILNQAAEQLQERLTELARDRARTDAILSAMEEGVLAVDHKGIILLANSVLSRHFSLENPVGRHYLELIRQREVGEVLDGVLKDGERRMVEIEVPHLRRAFALTGVSFPGAEGAPHGAILTFHDVTERRRLERMRRDFVANASHELRTPLTSIRGFVEALEDGAHSDPKLLGRFLGKIRNQSERMTALADDLLELSWLESDAHPPILSEVDVAALAATVTASFLDAARQKGVALTAAEAHGPARVTTDADRVRRMIENLVDNAIKYTQTGGTIAIGVTRDASGATIEVRDDGPGIPAEHQARVFERFYRVDKARSRELGGTGLGLAIVKHLAESIHARVELVSEVGCGSTFKIHLPPSV
jgi:two-component system, OmpR family, phosphate regulon sensor histidine kinase PhoR